jgi:hypothetical protein
MTSHFRSLAILAITALSLVGCTETSRPTASGKGNIRGMHAIVTAPDVNFLIEERSLGTLAYKQVSDAQRFDDLSYDFHFEARLPGDSSATRIATESLAVVPEMDYVFVLTGSLTSPSIVLWESEVRQWEDGETVFEAAAGHLAAGTGPVDIYLVPEGGQPVAGEARGSLSFGERLPPFDVEAGDYEFFVTAAGDPSTILFDSVPRSYAEMTSILFTIQDADPSITSSLSVRRIDQAGNSAELPQTGAPPTRRFFHAAFGTGDVDVYVDEDFSTPLVANLGFAQLSADVAVPTGARDYTYTAAGNPGAIVLEDEETTVATTRNTAFLMGAPGDLLLASFVDDRRPRSGFGRIRVNQVSINFETVDVYLLESGTDIADAGPAFTGLGSSFSSGYRQAAPGEYEITVTEAGEKTIAAGPVTVTLEDGSVVEAAIIDTADPNVLDIAIYDD